MKTRQIEKDHVFNVIKTGVREKFVHPENRRRLVRWFLIIPHNKKSVVVYDYECKVIEIVQEGIVTELRQYLKTIIE